MICSCVASEVFSENLTEHLRRREDEATLQVKVWFMPLYQAVVLAIVQGITEFLPISSTAHLVLVPWFLGWQDPGLTFDIAVHAGTLVAVLAYFRRDWVDLFKAGLGWGDPSSEEIRENRRLLFYLAVATVPGGLAGFFLKSYAETDFRHPWVIAGALIFVALIMWQADRRSGIEKEPGEGNACGCLDRRPGAGDGDCAGRIPLRRDDYRGIVSAHAARGGGALLLPAFNAHHRRRGAQDRDRGLGSGAAPRDALAICRRCDRFGAGRLSGYLLVS